MNQVPGINIIVMIRDNNVVLKFNIEFSVENTKVYWNAGLYDSVNFIK